MFSWGGGEGGGFLGDVSRGSQSPAASALLGQNIETVSSINEGLTPDVLFDGFHELPMMQSVHVDAPPSSCLGNAAFRAREHLGPERTLVLQQ